jgi:hypothetical protein
MPLVHVVAVTGSLLLFQPEAVDAVTLATQLQSNNPETRAGASKTLSERPELRPQVRDVLTAAAEEENAAVLAWSRQQHGVEEEFPEAGQQVYGALLEVTIRTDSRALRALIQSPFNEDSVFARKLSALGDPLVPLILERVRAGEIEKACGLAGEMGRLKLQNASGISDDSFLAMKGLLLRTLRSRKVSARMVAVRSLGMIGSKRDLPRLRLLEQTDPARDRRGRYVVREWAAEAVAAIERRVGIPVR